MVVGRLTKGISVILEIRFPKIRAYLECAKLASTMAAMLRW